MTYFADETTAAAALRDPATSRADLMSIAYAYPALGAEVARHPSAYPGLLDWLEQFGTPKARAEVAAVRADTPPPLYRPVRQDAIVTPTVMAPPAQPLPPRVTMPAPVAAAPVAAAPVMPTPTPAPAPMPAASPAPSRVVPTVPVMPASSRTIPLPTQTAAAADAPTAPIPVQTAPVAETVVPLAAAVVPPAAPVVSEAAHTAPVAQDAAQATQTAEYVSPFDEYSDETGSHKTAAASEDDYGDDGKPWSRAKKAVVIAVAAVIVVAAIVLGVVFGMVLPGQRALSDAKASFTTAAQKFNDAQTALAAGIQAAGPVASTASSDVNDPTTVTTLQTALTTAQSLVGVPASMASTTSAINQQVTDLNNHTTDVTNATQTLQSAVDAVQQSRVDLAVANLKTILTDAQSVSDSANWMSTSKDKTTAATFQALQDQITQVTAATTNPASLGTDTDTIVTDLQNMVAPLQSAIDDVNAANTKYNNTPVTTLLTGADQVTCGVNVCYNGTGGGDPLSVASVQVTVTGSKVVAKLCFMSTDQVDPTTCKVVNGTDGNNGWSENWTGTRSGTTAKVISITKDKADFSWGTVTFDSSAPNAKVISFTTADNCEKSDGSGDGQLVNGSCQ